MTPDANAARQARYKARLAESGAKQLNIMAPAAVHGLLREIASRTRLGEGIADVLTSVAQRVAGDRLFKVEARAEALYGALASLPPAPSGKVNIACRLGSRANAAIRRKLHGLGLVYADRMFVGAIDVAAKADIQARVLAANGALLS